MAKEEFVALELQHQQSGKSLKKFSTQRKQHGEGIQIMN